MSGRFSRQAIPASDVIFGWHAGSTTSVIPGERSEGRGSRGLGSVFTRISSVKDRPARPVSWVPFPALRAAGDDRRWVGRGVRSRSGLLSAPRRTREAHGFLGGAEQGLGLVDAFLLLGGGVA